MTARFVTSRTGVSLTNATYAAKVAALRSSPFGDPLNTTSVNDDGVGNLLLAGPALDRIFASMDGVENGGAKEMVLGAPA
jgi:hypothetical protein